MPDIVSSLSKVNKDSRYHVKSDSVAFAGSTLEMHWNKGKALKAIKSKKWDYIVLQGQSSTMMYDNTMKSFDVHLAKFLTEIKKLALLSNHIQV